MGDAYLPEDLSPKEPVEPYLPGGVKNQGDTSENVVNIYSPPPAVDRDFERRLSALEWAIKASQGQPAVVVVQNAEKFDAFLKGEKSES